MHRKVSFGAWLTLGTAVAAGAILLATQTPPRPKPRPLTAQERQWFANLPSMQAGAQRAYEQKRREAELRRQQARYSEGFSPVAAAAR